MERKDELTELRAYPVAEWRIDGDGDNEAPTEIIGYAAVFDQRSVDLGGFVEEIAPGAFAETLAANPDVSANIEHAGGLTTIGRTRNGTLSLAEDEHGLRVRIRPPNTSAGRDTLELVAGGYLDQMSFRFWVPPGGDSWSRLAENMSLRRVQKALLQNGDKSGDVTLTASPAYPQTSAEARNQAAIAAGQAAGGEGEGEAIAEGGYSDTRRRRLAILTIGVQEQ